jgi:hypothetical protein
MKFIKFVLRNKSEWTFPEEEAKKILASSQQLYPVKESDGQWHGRTINKADIIETTFDYDAERRWNEEHIPKLDLPKISEEQRKKNIEKLTQMKEEFIKKKILHR